MEGIGMPNITNDVLAAELRAVGTQVAKLDSRFENFSTQYARNDMLELRFKEIDTKLASMNLDIGKINSRKTFSAWAIPAAVGLLSSVMTYLIIKQIGG